MKMRMVNFLRCLVKIWFTVPFFLCWKTSKRAYEVFMQSVSESVEAVTPYFFSYNLRPKKAEQVVSIEKPSSNASRFSIIMQGPLVLKDDFTLETVKTYERIYPGVLVIISTWNTEDRQYIERIKQETSAKIVLSEYPQHSGCFNINYQTVSTVNGIKAAKEAGKEFVFKTRCDFRFYKKGLLEFMHSLLQSYPCSDSLLGQRYRIVMSSGREAAMFRPYFVEDLFLFGYIDDMLNYWDHEEITEDYSLTEFFKWADKNHLSWKQERIYTSIYTKRYIKKMTGEDIDISVKAYWDYLRKYIIVLSHKDVGSYWCKYDSRFEETAIYCEYLREVSDGMCRSYNWDFMSWYSLYKEKLEYSEKLELISETNYRKL